MPGQPLPTTRSRYTAEYGNAFKKDLAAIGPDAKQRIVAGVEAFMRDWRAGESDEGLREAWRCKPIVGPDAKAYFVSEIEPIGHYRVIFTEVARNHCLYLVAAFRKTSTYKKDTISAVKRARIYWEALS